MDTNVRLDPNVPSGSPSGASRTKSRGILGRLIRRWWQVLLLSLLLSLLVIYGIKRSVEPTFVAFSTLRVEATQPELFGSLKTGFVESSTVQPYLETQINVITSDRVLEEVIADPSVGKLPMITGSKDAKVDLRKILSVEIVEGTNLIRVSLELANGEQAAMIVQAVVDSYMRQNTEFNRSANRNLQTILRAQLDTKQREIMLKKGELDKLVQDGKVVLGKPRLNPNAFKNDNDPTPQPSISSVTEEQVKTLADIFIRCDIEYLDAQAELNAVELVRARTKDAVNKHVEGQGVLSEEKLRELEVAVEKARRKRIAYARYLDSLKVETKTTSIDTHNAMLLDHDLGTLMTDRDHLKRNLEQLQFEALREDFRVELLDKASVPKTPTDNKMLKYMAAAPSVVFFLILGVFLVVEINAGREAARDSAREPA